MPRPPLPAPNVRDDRETPLLWVQDGVDGEVIWLKRTPEYFCAKGWTASRDLPVVPRRGGPSQVYKILFRLGRAWRTKASLSLASKVGEPSHREPHHRSENDRGIKPEEGPVGLTAKISLKFKNLKKSDAPQPDQPDQPFRKQGSAVNFRAGRFPAAHDMQEHKDQENRNQQQRHASPHRCCRPID
jgi:hypothetical protein